MLHNKIHLRKQKKRHRLNWFIEFRLRKRGRKDWTKKNVEQDKDGNYTSPFINQEIHLFLADVQAELEELNYIQKNLQKEILNNYSVVKKVGQKLQDLSDKDEYWVIPQVEHLRNFNISSHVIQENSRMQINGEVEAVKLRCRKLYEMLIARLSAYWAGVLQESGGAVEIIPEFQTDYLLDEVEVWVDALEKGDNIYADSK